jgi:hypothetical protein
MTKPWFKFFPADWRGDPRLRMCSLPARGLWIDLISYMHEGQPYGHLTIDGVVPSLSDIAALVARPLGEVRKAMDELEVKNIFSRDENGAIVSRRMVRDKTKADKDRENGLAGGNPSLTPELNRGVNPVDKAQRLEAREPEKKNRRVARATTPLDEKFEQFWSEYPKRDGDNPKAPARKAFHAAVNRGENADEIIAGLRIAKERNRGKIDPKFIPQCRTWVQQERWKDHLAKPELPEPIDWDARCASYRESRSWLPAWGPEPGFSGCRVPRETLLTSGLIKPEDDLSIPTFLRRAG